MHSLAFDTFSSRHINIPSLQKHFDDLSEFFLHWTGPSLSLLFLKLGYPGLILIYSIFQAAVILSLVTENIKQVVELNFIYSRT